MHFQRPGRQRLYAMGHEEYGHTQQSLRNCVFPLIFAGDSVEEDEEFYGIAGTVFLVRYRGRMFAVTAQHCLSSGNGDDVRIALNPETGTFLPLKNLHRLRSNPPKQDWADIAIFEAAPELLSVEEQQSRQSLVLDPLRVSTMRIKANANLYVPGFPKYLNGVDYDRSVIHTQGYLTTGKYLRPAGRPHIHVFEFHDLDGIDWVDGMSGSPIFSIEKYPEAHFFGFLGILIKAQKMGTEAEFIDASILYQLFDKVIDA